MKDLKRLYSYHRYKIKNKSEYRMYQKDIINRIEFKVCTKFAIILILLTLLIRGFANTKFIPFLDILAIIVFILYGSIMLLLWGISHPILMYIIGVPIISIMIATLHRYYYMFFCLIICVCLYIILIFCLPVNMFKSITVKISFIPTIISIGTLLISNNKSYIFNFMTNGAEEKVITSIKNLNLTLTSKRKFAESIVKVFQYLYVEIQANHFYGELSVLAAELTIPFLVGSILVILKTSFYDWEANRKWRCISFSNNVTYDDLIECAYYGGKKYENLILANPNYLKVIKDNENYIEKDIKKNFFEKMVNRWDKFVNK